MSGPRIRSPTGQALAEAAPGIDRRINRPWRRRTHRVARDGGMQDATRRGGSGSENVVDGCRHGGAIAPGSGGVGFRAVTIVPDSKDWTWVLARPWPGCGPDT